MTITFTPVRQTPEVLERFLAHVEGELWVYDDNTDPESSALLRESGARILPRIDLPEGGYGRDGKTHEWQMPAVYRVAKIKNYAIDLFMQTGDPWLFLLDSDVIIQPGTVNHLATPAPVTSLVYWSQWNPGDPWLPNVWDQSHYGFTETPARFARPGHYPVGGLGAATMVNRWVFEKVRFDPIPNWPMWGEDRWFCLRAAYEGIPLQACTHVQPFHVYRDEQLSEVADGWTAEKAEAWRRKHLDASWRMSVVG